MKISEKIQALRREKGWSQERLGEELGLSRQAVSKWESGAAAPTVDNLIELARVFGVSVDELLETGYAAPRPEGADGEAAEEPISAEGVRALFAEFTAAQHKRARRQIWIAAAGGVVLAGLVAGLVAFAVSYRHTVNDLRAQIGSVSGQVGGISASVNAQMDQLRRSVEEQLTRQESALADYTWNVEKIDLTTGRVTLHVDAMPKEGGILSFTAAGTGFETVEVMAEEQGGHRFTADLTLPIADEIRLSATLYDDTNSLLETIYDLRRNYVSSQSVEIVFGYSHTVGMPTAEVSPQITIERREAEDASSPMQLAGPPVKMGYTLKLGNETLETDEWAVEGGYEWYERNLEPRSVPVDRMEELVCMVWCEDADGRRVSARKVCEGLGADRP